MEKTSYDFDGFPTATITAVPSEVFIACAWMIEVRYISICKTTLLHLNFTPLAIGIVIFLNLDILQNFLINRQTDKFKGLPMSYVVHEPTLYKVNNKTEERDCVILGDWGWCNWYDSCWPLVGWAPVQLRREANPPSLCFSDSFSVKGTWLGNSD